MRDLANNSPLHPTSPAPRIAGSPRSLRTPRSAATPHDAAAILKPIGSAPPIASIARSTCDRRAAHRPEASACAFVPRSASSALEMARLRVMMRTSEPTCSIERPLATGAAESDSAPPDPLGPLSGSLVGESDALQHPGFAVRRHARKRPIPNSAARLQRDQRQPRILQIVFARKDGRCGQRRQSRESCRAAGRPAGNPARPSCCQTGGEVFEQAACLIRTPNEGPREIEFRRKARTPAGNRMIQQRADSHRTASPLGQAAGRPPSTARPGPVRRCLDGCPRTVRARPSGRPSGSIPKPLLRREQAEATLGLIGSPLQIAAGEAMTNAHSNRLPKLVPPGFVAQRLRVPIESVEQHRAYRPAQRQFLRECPVRCLGHANGTDRLIARNTRQPDVDLRTPRRGKGTVDRRIRTKDHVADSERRNRRQARLRPPHRTDRDSIHAHLGKIAPGNGQKERIGNVRAAGVQESQTELPPEAIARVDGESMANLPGFDPRERFQFPRGRERNRRPEQGRLPLGAVAPGFRRRDRRHGLCPRSTERRVPSGPARRQGES